MITPTTYIFRDTYSRVLTNTWGVADSGHPWGYVDVGSINNYDVDGTRGTITLPDPAATLHIVEFSGDHLNFRFKKTLRVSAVATAAPIVSDLHTRTVGFNTLVFRAQFSPTEFRIEVYKVVSSVVTVLGSVSKGAYLPNDDWTIKGEFVGNSVNAKAWRASNPEPVSWDIVSTATDVSLPGRIQLSTRREAGNTNTNVVVSYDYIEVTTDVPTVPSGPQGLNDYEFKFDTDGIVLNSGLGIAQEGSPIWDVNEVKGLDLPDVKTSDKEFDGIDGGVLEAENIKMRTVVMECALVAHPDDSLEGYLDQLKENFAPIPRSSTQLPDEPVDRNTRPLYFKAPGVPERFLYAKPVGVHYDWSGDRRFNSAPFQLVFQAEDPVLYSPTQKLITVAAGAKIVVWYEGNYPGYVTATISGACTFPSINHAEHDRTLAFNNTLLAGEYMTVNFKKRTAIESPSGDSVRGNVYIEDWWRLRKGANTIRLTVGTGTPTLTLQWRDGWY